MKIYEILDSLIASLASALWGTPLVILLLGGLFFAVYSRMVPILYFKHAIEILLGKYDSEDDPGQITHFEALSSALAGTVGMGNIAGVGSNPHRWAWCYFLDVDYCYFRNEYEVFYLYSCCDVSRL